MTTTAPPPNLVTRCPVVPKKPPAITAIPAPTSPNATQIAVNSGKKTSLLPRYPANLSTGNLPIPCKKNDIPNENLNNHGANFVNGFAILSRYDEKLMLCSFAIELSYK